MQKKRIVVTLDPDYIPWEHNEDAFKLRHKRIKIPKLLIAFVAIVAIFTFAIFSKIKADRQADLAAAVTPAAQGDDPFKGWCEYGGSMLSQGVHNIGGTDRECKDGKIQ